MILLPAQRATFVNAVRRWGRDTQRDGHPLLLYVLNCIGHALGEEPLDPLTALNPLDMVSIDAVEVQLNRLIDEVGLGEDFLVTSLVRAVDEFFERGVTDRAQSMESFREVQRRLDGLRQNPEAASAYLAERGLGSGDLEALAHQVAAEIARLEDPDWATERRQDLEAWREASAPLLSMARRDEWERERFELAGQALSRFFRGPDA